MRCYRKRGNPVNPDKRADVHPQGVGRIRSAPSSLTAALAIGPYKVRYKPPPEAARYEITTLCSVIDS